MRSFAAIVTHIALACVCGSALGDSLPAAQLKVEEGFVDLDLAITDVSKSLDGVVSVTGRGNIDNLPVGLIVDILPDWAVKRSAEEGSVFLYWGKARYRSLGIESDNLMLVLGRSYGVSPVPKSMAKSIPFLAVGLADDPRKIMDQPIHMKLFFDCGVEERYAEIFTNIDLGAKRLELHEKDPEYRKALLRALNEGA